MRSPRSARRALVAGVIALLPGAAPTAPAPARVVAPAACASLVAVVAPARVDVAPHDEGVARLCAGGADVALGPRPMTHAERAACAAAGRPAFEVPVGYEAVVVVARREDAWIDAITPAEMARVFARAAEGDPTRASDVRAGWPDVPLRLAVPSPGSAAIALLDDVAALPGGAREDVARVASAADLAPLAAPALIAIAPFPPTGALPAGLRAVPVGDAPATTAAIQRHAYGALARLVYAHVAASSAARPAVSALVGRLVDAPAGLVPLSDEARAFAHAGLAARSR